MKAIVAKYNETSLILRILIGLIIGVILGIAMPQATFLPVLGNLFVGALKAIAPILVFVLVISSLAQASKGLGSQFRTVIFLYMLSTLVAAFFAVIAGFLFPVTLKLTTAAADQAAPVGIGEVFQTLLNNLVANPVSSLMNANYIGILFWAVVLGLAFKNLAAPATLEVLSNVSDAVSAARSAGSSIWRRLVSWVWYSVPFPSTVLRFSRITACWWRF